MNPVRPLLTLGLLLVAAPALAQTSEGATLTKSGTVRVVANASITVKPDLAEVDLGVSTDKPTAAAATSENARKMEQIVAAMKKEAGQGGEVKTVGFEVNPRYGEPRPNSDRQPVVGYTVTSTVRVRTGDVNAAGRILDAAFKLGANNVQRVAFLLKDQEPAQAEALKQAAGKARGRASAMASALGLKVGPVVTISEGYAEAMPIEGGAEAGLMRTMKMPATPIEAGSLEVRATVTVVFALGR
jgi:uncharacterized protein YggE